MFSAFISFLLDFQFCQNINNHSSFFMFEVLVIRLREISKKSSNNIRRQDGIRFGFVFFLFP